MMLNGTVNNISAISWRRVLLVKETGVPEKKHDFIDENKFTNIKTI